MNVPNLLTILRIILIPFFSYFLYNRQDTIAVIIFLVAGGTDILDGFIARKYHQVTNWGKLADPAADKLLQLSALAILTVQNRLPIIILIIVLLKEIAMSAGSLFLLKNKVVVQANWYGKLATVVFYFAVVMILFHERYSLFFVILAVVATIFAFLMYFKDFLKIMKKPQDFQ